MLVTCPECSTRYSLDAKALGQSGRQVRCASCGHEWFVQAPAEEDGPVEDDGAVQAAKTESSAGETVQSAVAQPDTEPEAPETEPEPPADAEPAPKPPHRAWRERNEARARRRRRLIAVSAWAGVAASLVLVFTLATSYRVAVVRAMPRSASFFKLIGLPVNRWGVDLQDLKSVKTTQDGVPVLRISGKMFNPGKRRRPAPQVRISLRDETGHEIHAWTVPPKSQEIPPKSAVAFATVIKDVPPQAVSIRYSLASKAGQQMQAEQKHPGGH